MSIGRNFIGLSVAPKTFKKAQRLALDPPLKVSNTRYTEENLLGYMLLGQILGGIIVGAGSCFLISSCIHLFSKNNSSTFLFIILEILLLNGMAIGFKVWMVYYLLAKNQN